MYTLPVAMDTTRVLASGHAGLVTPLTWTRGCRTTTTGCIPWLGLGLGLGLDIDGSSPIPRLRARRALLGVDVNSLIHPR